MLSCCSSAFIVFCVSNFTGKQLCMLIAGVDALLLFEAEGMAGSA
jgi:hypothetical protein